MGSSTPSFWKRLAREPLLHFVLIGTLLFYIGSRNAPDDASAGNEIVISEGDIDQMLVSWMAQGRPPPPPEAIRSMVEQKVREEVLYREAISMGLDKDDTIVKRRLAQKMDFLAEDLSSLEEPTTAELRQWFDGNLDKFVQPPRVSFRHVYYSFDVHGKDAREMAARELSTGAQPVNGDRFMFQSAYAERTEADLYSIFGPAFSHQLFTLTPGQWVGPVESPYGWHAVFVEDLSPPITPGFEEVEADVKAAYVAARRAEFREEGYRVMRQKYKVVLPTFDPEATPGATAKEPAGGEAS